MTSLRWLVVGTGGVGGYFGGLLAHGGHDVTFLARGEHLRAMRTSGLRLETTKGEYTIERPKAVESVDGDEPFDVVLFCVKTYDNVTAAKAIAGAVDDRSVVISIQNGMDNDVQLRQLLPLATVYPGLANIISARVAPGVIRQSGGPCVTIFGDPETPANPLLRDVAADMRAAGIAATASRNIERDQWDKFVFIIAFSGMTALCRSPIGGVLNDDRALHLYRRCAEEVIAVAEADGVDIDPNVCETTMSQTEAYRGAQETATSSLLRDVLAGRPTEIESLHGAVVRRAERHHLEVPINSMVYTAIRLGALRAPD